MSTTLHSTMTQTMKNSFHLDAPAWESPGWKGGSRPPRVGLFVPCYIDQLFPRIAFATLHISRQCGVHNAESWTRQLR